MKKMLLGMLLMTSLCFAKVETKTILVDMNRSMASTYIQYADIIQLELNYFINKNDVDTIVDVEITKLKDDIYIITIVYEK